MTYEGGRIPVNAPTDPKIISCLDTPILQRLLAETNIPHAQIAINSELAARAAWRGPARWALLLSTVAIVVSITALVTR